MQGMCVTSVSSGQPTFGGYYNRRRPHSTIDYEIPARAMETFKGRCRMAFQDYVEGGVKAA